MDLRTGRVITRRRVTEIPVTELVIPAVENMGIVQGIHTLKITGRYTTPLYPTDWIAGVEYDHMHDNNNDYIEDEEIENEALYDRIDPQEIADLRETIADLRETQNDPEEQEQVHDNENNESHDDDPEEREQVHNNENDESHEDDHKETGTSV
jgi:hypothetical protein